MSRSVRAPPKPDVSLRYGITRRSARTGRHLPYGRSHHESTVAHLSRRGHEAAVPARAISPAVPLEDGPQASSAAAHRQFAVSRDVERHTLASRATKSCSPARRAAAGSGRSQADLVIWRFAGVKRGDRTVVNDTFGVVADGGAGRR